MQQQKRIVVQTRVGQEARSPKHHKKHKIKQVKSKIFKNLNQIPIELNHDTKENHPYNRPLRPASSLLPEEAYSHKVSKAVRVESALSQYADHKEGNNRKRLSLDSTGKRYERDSLASRNSLSKKMSKNNRSIEEGIKMKIADQRKRSNVSCLSACEEGQYRTSKKHSVKQKRPSVSNLNLPVRPKQKQSKDTRNLKTGDKSKSKSKNKRKKSKLHLDKSKVSTAAINTHERGFAKKKQSQSNSTVHIGVVLPKKKKKVVKKKTPRKENNDQFSLEQYPINKYDVQYSTEKLPRHRVPVKSKSKSRRGSSDKQPRRSLFEIDYMSCINIPSSSSGVINSAKSKSSEQSNNNIKIIDNWEFRYIADENAGSVNLEEIRHFESYHLSHQKQQRDFMEKNFREQTKYSKRRLIEEQIAEDYPHFEELELKFLASVIFIQRKWREHKLYRQVFNNFGKKHKLSQLSLEQSNSKQLNISLSQKSAQKSHTKKQVDRGEKAERQIIHKFADGPKAEEGEGNRLRNNIYLDFTEVEGFEEKMAEQCVYKREKMSQEHLLFQEERSSKEAFSAKSSRYEFLQQELFPSMNYLKVKQEQLKQELITKIAQLNELQKTGAIDGREYLKLRSQCQSEFDKQIQELNRSRKDLKKGYLRFIDTCKDIKQESGLRRVSSQRGPMAQLYLKIFNLDSSLKAHSQSSESMKRLSKRVLIRRQYFQSQKIESNLLDPIQQVRSARERGKVEESASFSARVLKREQFTFPESQVQNTVQSLEANRIKEGFLLSPQSQLAELTASPEPNSFRRGISVQRKEKQVLEEVIAALTHELFVELVRIDESRENSIDILQDGIIESHRNKIKVSEIKDFQIVEETDSVEMEKQEREEDFEIVEESKFREMFKIEGLADRSELEVNRKHRNSNTYHISPVTYESIPFESEEILSYSREMFNFIKASNIHGEIIEKLNKNQGFTPKQYLKFLRDYQIPDEEYQPLISNEIFVEWEEKFGNEHLSSKDQEGYMKRQATTIFHRCIFECLIGLLEDKRPSGDKGQPFPWEKVLYFNRPLALQHADGLFMECVSRLQELLLLRCGIIQQKQMVVSEQDMERVHQQNQDKIISMLQLQLSVSPDSWYQVQQHGLQIKLQIEGQLFEYVMLQALDELLQIL